MQSSTKHERYYKSRGYSAIAGVDEAGRGPLAGPVVACALILPPKLRKLNLVKANLTKLSLQGLRDSKKLSPKQREAWYRVFLSDPDIQWGIGKVGERVIDKINIHQATRLAMKRAVLNLSRKARLDFLIVDGTMRIETAIPQKAVIRGDELSRVCAAASIVAKVTRDRLMARYHKQYPEYGFLQHKGYGTALHMERLEKYGPSPLHRKTFEPIARLSQ